MSGIYNNTTHLMATGDLDLETATIKAMLLRSSSTYTFNPDHDTVQAVLSNGGVEISVASYLRQTLTGGDATVNDTDNATYVTFDDIAFGALESGQTVKAILIYKHVTNDTDSVPLFYIDNKTTVRCVAPSQAPSTGNITGATQADPVVITSTAHGLSNGDIVKIQSVGGMTQINNARFTVANVTSDTFELDGIDGSGYTAYTSGGTWKTVETVYIDTLEDDIPDGASLSFSGGVTGTLAGNAFAGDEYISVSDLSGSVAYNATASVTTTSNLPIALSGASFTVPIPDDFLTM